ncbi:MAG: OsmC family protein, partial [Rubrobacter sp.]|nr:OsmC family protein [Rubrobacter sp.]
RDLDPMVIDEPPNLLGTDTAPNPSEAALAALGSCISVGLMSNATARGVTLYEISIELEGDIDTGAVWGTGNTGEDVSAGFTAVRVKTTLKGDASPEELADMEKTAVRWSPVVNTFTNPVAFSTEVETG